MAKTRLRWLYIPLRLLWRRRAFWSRVLFCWAFGWVLLLYDETTQYDLRFRLRDRYSAPQDVVLVLISESDWANNSSHDFNFIRPLKEVGYLTDSYYWQEETWALILDQILKLDPRGVGVSFYFGENIGQVSENPIRKPLFEDKRLIWGARLDPDGRTLFPRFSRGGGKNTGLVNLPPDSDGILRRIPPPRTAIPDFGVKLANMDHPIDLPKVNRWMVNYAGPAETFPTISFSRLLEGAVRPSEVKGKFVIIGSKDSPGHLYSTPLGQMTQAEVLANITHNALANQWIKRANLRNYTFFSGLLLAGTIWIMFAYPQAVALMILVGLGCVLAALSTWIFDRFFFWIPVLSPMLQMVVTFITFISYQLTRKERRTWQLEQEKKYIFEIEQFKNNFVSLISHDLKTPIAKIQGVIDRLLRSSHDESLLDDLGTLRSSTLDLHRYIQSILSVTRVESQSFRLRKTAVDINETILKVVEKLRPLAAAKKITVATRLTPLFSLEVDEELIQEVILNLLENAIKYTPDGGAVEVRSDEIDDQILVAVKDNGEGIDSAELSQIWNKFYRGKKHGLTTKGTGLGLYLVKYFVELHGGQVFIESRYKEGTEVGFRLPVQTESD